MKRPIHNSPASFRPDFTDEELELQSLVGESRGTCPPLDVLQALGEEVLPPELERAASSHLDTCSLCQQLLADLKTEDQNGSFAKIAEMTASEDQRLQSRTSTAALRLSSYPNRLTPVLMATAAAALVAVALFTVEHWHHSAPTQASTPAPHSSSPVVLPRAAAPVLEATLDIPFAPLAPPDGTRSLQTRGASEAEPSIQTLLPAFRAYNSANYASAASSFQHLERSYPESLVVPLYLGVSQLALGDDGTAAASLQLALSRATSAGNSPAADEARWYSAIAANRQHDPASAKRFLAQLCDSPASPYAARSCELLKTAAH
jgi:TolA-binding protein